MGSQEYIDYVANKIIDNINPLKVILFGSYAYGTPKSNSDIDFFILMESQEKPVKRRINVSKLFLDRDYPLDFIVYNPVEYQKKIEQNDSFIKEINKGKVLYER